MKKITIVILNWNGVHHLKNYLPRVIANTPADICDIVVADNGSTDSSCELIRNEFPQIILWEFDKNYGFAGGYNKAIELVKTDYAILLNSDAAPEKGWIQPLLSLAEGNPRIAAIMPKIRSDRNPESFEYAGAAGGFIDKLGYPFCQGRIMNTVEKDNKQYDTPRRVFWATGAAMFVRTSAYRDAGGLDEDFFAHMEEIDLCWRMQLLDYEIWVEPAAIVYHLGGGTLSEDSPNKALLNHRNNLAMLYKNLDKSNLFPILAIRMILDGVSGVMYLAQGRKQHFQSVIKAHNQFRAAKHSLKIKRQNIQNRRKSVPYGIYNGSIILRYMFGRKFFPNNL
jgi:GT2 family glycosyltransferase